MIYLDNAATTYPKPERVWRAADLCARRCGNPGRGAHILSREAAKTVFGCREEIASLFGGEPENVVFTLNATYALNLAIRALAKPGGRILISGMEHNAVLRPAAMIGGGRYDVFDPRGGEEAVLRAAEAAIRPDTALMAVCHVSNLCGLTLPVEKLGALCRRKGIPLVIDASQSAGRTALTLSESGADAICAPGHKGLYGLQGSGFALFSDRAAERAGTLRPFIAGGTGVNSRELVMPDFLPERLEAGTLPTPAIASLSEGIRFVREIGVGTIAEQENRLGGRMREALSMIPGVTLYGAEYGGGTVLFNVWDLDAETIGERLDGAGICVRTGLHCCPLGHDLLGTGRSGAVRASVSVFTRREEIDELAARVERIAHERR